MDLHITVEFAKWELLKMVSEVIDKPTAEKITDHVWKKMTNAESDNNEEED